MSKKKEYKIYEEENSVQSVLHQGDRSLNELLAVQGIDISEEDTIVIDGNYARVFAITGMRDNLTVGWLDDLFNYDGDLDVVFYIEPTEERLALEELTRNITQYESQLQIEVESGKNKRTTELPSKIRKLYRQREKIENNLENLYKSEILYIVYSDSKKNLDKETEKISSKLSGKRIISNSLFLMQDDGYKSCLPYGKNFITTYYRNFNTGSLTASFPFYNSELGHDSGTFVAMNMQSWLPIYLDFFNKNLLYNANINVFGMSGIGKTYFVSLLIGREVFSNVTQVIVDAEADFVKLAKVYKGTVVQIRPDSKFRMNPCDIDEEDVLDDDGNPIGEKKVNVKAKASELLNLLGIMSRGVLKPDNERYVTDAIVKSYMDLGINENPDSLYEIKDYYDSETHIYTNGKCRKQMPQLSTIVYNLEQIAESKQKQSLFDVVDSLKMFVQGGIYDLFDCQTSEEIDFEHSPIVDFDVSKLDDDILRPIGMYIVMTWTWSKFINRNIYQKKRVICDETWMMLKKSLAGSKYTAAFLENCSRRIRKRNGGLLVSSQKLLEFTQTDEGNAILSNAYVKCIFRPQEFELEAVKDAFKLSDGEVNFVSSAGQGQMILKVNNESTCAYAFSFDFENELYSKNKILMSDAN